MREKRKTQCSGTAATGCKRPFKMARCALGKRAAKADPDGCAASADGLGGAEAAHREAHRAPPPLRSRERCTNRART
jgi:hypothetical protein